MNDILKYWPMIVALAVASMAWGANRVEIESLKDVQKEQAKIQAKQERIDERTEAMQKALEDIKTMQMMLLERTQ